MARQEAVIPVVEADGQAAAPQTTQKPPREHITVTSAQVEAAKLQITLDRKFGRKTPKIIKLVAAAK